MNRKKTRETLNVLNDLLLEIEQKERERKGAIKFNKVNAIKELGYNLKQLGEEIQNLELDFKLKSREL